MNLTALNGILIVALTMALALHWNDKVLIFLAFGMAGVSYIINLMDEFQVTAVRGPLFVLTVLLGLAAYGYGLLKLVN